MPRVLTLVVVLCLPGMNQFTQMGMQRATPPLPLGPPGNQVSVTQLLSLCSSISNTELFLSRHISIRFVFCQCNSHTTSRETYEKGVYLDTDATSGS